VDRHAQSLRCGDQYGLQISAVAVADDVTCPIVGAPVSQVRRPHQQTRVLVVEEGQGTCRAGDCRHRALDAQIAEHVLRAAPQGQACTGFTQLARRFMNLDWQPRAGEGNGCCQPAQARPDHQHRIICSHGGKLAQFGSADKDYRLGMSGQLC